MEENNKIIAEFMGFTFEKNLGYYDNEMLLEQIVYEQQNGNCFNELLFDKSWDWLMKVVEKIESIKDPYHGRFGVYIGSNSCTIQSTNFRPDKPIPNPPHYYDNIVLNTKIESTYYVVLNFINFYNKKKRGIN